jgi:hypothetical protein
MGMGFEGSGFPNIGAVVPDWKPKPTTVFDERKAIITKIEEASTCHGCKRAKVFLDVTGGSIHVIDTNDRLDDDHIFEKLKKLQENKVRFKVKISLNYDNKVSRVVALYLPEDI